MNSPNPYSEDELDHLVRGTLNAWVGTQEPPEHIWNRTLSFGLPSSVATVYVDERSVSPGVMHLSNESDVGSLRTFSQLDAAQQITVEPESHRPGLAPLNVAPHPTDTEKHYESDMALSLRKLLTTDNKPLKESTAHMVNGGQPSAASGQRDSHSPLWERSSFRALLGTP
jgi:hypothetical protein